MDPNQNLGENPAATIADAAMNGATPVVTTTDLNASDVAPEPTLQTPVLDTSALGAPVLDTAALEAAAAAETAAPENNGPVSLAPSADFQMDAVSTVSAVQNGADGNLAAQNEDIMIGQPLEDPVNAAEQTSAPDMNATPEAHANDAGIDPGSDAQNPEENKKISAEELKQEFKDDPIIAAAPVPGSIGSAKSYADIQRAEAEKAARMAAKNAKTPQDKKNIIIIAAVAVIALIGVVIGGIAIFSGNSSTPATPAAPATEYPEEASYSTLSCKRNLVAEEYVSYGASSGTQENIFYFKDDVLDGLATNFAYSYQDQVMTNFWRDKLAADYGVTPDVDEEENKEEASEETEEPDTSEGTESETSGKKTTAEMLHHYVRTKDFTVIHGMEIKSEDINDWLASDAYSDVTYGATENGAAAPAEEGEEVEETESGEVVRNLQYYNRLQNSIDYKCEISKGY